MNEGAKEANRRTFERTVIALLERIAASLDLSDANLPVVHCKQCGGAGMQIAVGRLMTERAPCSLCNGRGALLVR